MKLKLISLCLAVILLAACSEPVPGNRAVYLLMDTSGTYTEELEKGQNIMN